MDGFYVKVDSKRLTERLDLARALFNRPDSAYEAIRETITERVMKRFDTKTDPTGLPWAEWAPRTAAERAKVGGVMRQSGPVSLLELTGAMRKSFFAKTMSGVVRAGFTVSYAAAHETGTRKKDGSVLMPARRVLTDGKGALGRNDRIALGMAVRRAITASLEKI